MTLIEVRAHTMVARAVRAGELTRPKVCDSCSATHRRIHAHHDDYSLPLIVRWLCAKCHQLWHLKHGAGAGKGLLVA